MRVIQIITILLLSSINDGYILAQTIVYNTFSNSFGIPLHVESSVPSQISNYVPGTRQKQAGKTMIIAGGLLQIGGVISFISHKPSHPDGSGAQIHPDDGSVVDNRFIGAFMVAGGTALAVTGTIIRIVGVRKYNRYKSEQSVSFKIGNSSSLIYRF